ncbi:MAG TPA: alpha/beta fold hydrolase, partial [Candidatus Aquilonibacter sp.]|nr:alpha/beta fold hydrolase [Candidatus Aquilonibacter sp.]
MSSPTSIHVTRWGDSGPRVVLIHGGTQGTAVGGETNFSNQRVLAERGWQLIVPDRPGHGKSVDPGRPDDAEADGTWVADLLGDGAHLLGHSFGGCVALSAAARRPEAVTSLTLIEPAMFQFAPGNPAVRRQLFAMMWAMTFSFSDARLARRMLKLLGIPPEVRGTGDQAQLARLGKSLRRVRVPKKEALTRELEAIKTAGIPLLVITGGWNPAFEASSDAVAAAAGGRRAV